MRDGEEYSADLKVGQINIQSVSSKIINKDDNKSVVSRKRQSRKSLQYDDEEIIRYNNRLTII